MADMPEIEVAVIANGEPARGTGEPTVTIVAPAIGNAIFSADGARVTWAADHFGQCERGHEEGDLEHFSLRLNRRGIPESAWF
jgi:hypothetical protein